MNKIQSQKAIQPDRILCLDIGNINLYGGVFDKDKLIISFRRDMSSGASADELGIYFRTVIRENGLDPFSIARVAVSSVVPSIIHSLRNASIKYFGNEPFVLKAGVKTGLKITIKNPSELGADRIANAISAVKRYPGKNLIIVDFGTATTFCAVSKNADYLGCVISPGLKISMESLEARTARLPKVEIIKPENIAGRSNVESIQSGLFYSTVGGIKEICSRLNREAFKGEESTIIATGGFSRLFEKENLFEAIHADLVLDGVRIAAAINL